MLQSVKNAGSIAPSESGVRSVLRAILVGGEARNVLPRRYLQAQSATVGLRSESSDLIHPREIFRACGEEYVPGKPPLAPSRQRKSHSRHSRRPPFCPCSPTHPPLPHCSQPHHTLPRPAQEHP